MSNSVGKTVNIITWIILAIVILFLIKGGYPVLIALEVMQIIYMHLFILLDPMPFLEFTFLKSLSSFHFTFFPSLFDNVLGGYTSPATPSLYTNFLSDTTFLRNCSPLIIIFSIFITIFIVFKLLANKTINRWKLFRKFCQGVVDDRIKYSIINDAFWLTFTYAMFFAMFQFRYTATSSLWQTINLLFAALTIAIFISYTLFMMYLGQKYRKDVS
jgi:hypothetical protein